LPPKNARVVVVIDPRALGARTAVERNAAWETDMAMADMVVVRERLRDGLPKVVVRESTWQILCFGKSEKS
jgi:hypothetical protein